MENRGLLGKTLLKFSDTKMVVEILTAMSMKKTDIRLCFLMVIRIKKPSLSTNPVCTVWFFVVSWKRIWQWFIKAFGEFAESYFGKVSQWKKWWHAKKCNSPDNMFKKKMEVVPKWKHLNDKASPSFGQLGVTLINKSGLYTLTFRSKKESIVSWRR